MGLLLYESHYSTSCGILDTSCSVLKICAIDAYVHLLPCIARIGLP